MTFFSNAPSPSPVLVAPSNQNPTRRPSKLLPSERLHRPSQSMPSVTPANGSSILSNGRDRSTSIQGNRLAAPPSPSGHLELPLPPLPEQPTVVPLALLPSGGARKKSPVSVPSTLRPAVAPPTHVQSSHSPTAYVHYEAPVPTAPSHKPYVAPLSSPYPAQMAAPPPGYVPHVPVSSPVQTVPYMQPPSPVPPMWDNHPNSGPPLAFPMPTPIPGPPPSNVSYIPRSPHIYPVQKFDDSETLDPHLLARYQSPLPLPSGSNKTKPVAQRSPPPPPQRDDPSQDRIAVLRSEEEKMRRRMEQEKRDRELALELDRQFNSSA